MTKDEFVDLIIEVCRTDATEDEQKAAAQKLAAGPALPAILALATFAQTWLEDLEAECDSACDRDDLHEQFRAGLFDCVDVTSSEAAVV